MIPPIAVGGLNRLTLPERNESSRQTTVGEDSGNTDKDWSYKAMRAVSIDLEYEVPCSTATPSGRSDDRQDTLFWSGYVAEGQHSHNLPESTAGDD